MKRILNIAFALLFGLSLAACDFAAETTGTDVSAVSGSAVTLVWAEVNPPDSLMGRTAMAFKEKVEELTADSVQIDIRFSAVLGDESTVLDTMVGGGGTIDMTRIATFSLNTFGAKKLSLLSMPFIFTDRTHFWRLANSDFGQVLLNEPSELGLGVKGLFFVEEGFRHFFFNKAVADISDLAGMKIRVSNDPIMTGMVNALQASSAVVPFGELYTSLSSHIVDGAEQPIVNYQSNAFYEVADTMLLDGHTLGCGEVLILERTFAALSESQQAAFQEASRYASAFNAQLSEESEQKCMAELTDRGVHFVDVPDKTAWAEACQALIDAFTTGYEEDYRTILDMSEERAR